MQILQESLDFFRNSIVSGRLGQGYAAEEQPSAKDVTYHGPTPATADPHRLSPIGLLPTGM
jgi:hypothetical protein